jgi:hypothetical protein
MTATALASIAALPSLKPCMFRLPPRFTADGKVYETARAKRRL